MSLLDKQKKSFTQEPIPNNNHQQDTELIRFGHTVCLINKQQAVLFGGAKGHSTDYVIKNDCYLFKLDEHVWIKLNPSGTIPSERAAHAATSNENNKMFIYGGAEHAGNLASESLHALNLSNGSNSCYWEIIETTGVSPGKRYGHSMAYIHPNVFVFGGNIGTRLSNDIFAISTEQDKYEWVKIEPTSELPSPRMYQSFNTCKYGIAKGMIIIFGGRGENHQPLNDIWGFRRHRDGRWDWTKAPYQNFSPLKRFQHTSTFYYKFLIILGGRLSEEGKDIPIQVYDTETSEWAQVSYLNKFRHTSWLSENMLYSHGGFDNSSPQISKNDLFMIDLLKLFSTDNVLKTKLDSILDNIKITSLTTTTKYSSLSQTNQTNQQQLNQSNQSNSNKNIMKVNNNSNTSQTSYYSALSNKSKPSPTLSPIKIKEYEISTVNNVEGGAIVKKVILDEKGKYKVQNEQPDENLVDMFIKVLLRPIEYLRMKTFDEESFYFNSHQILSLTHEAINIVKDQPMVVKVTTPCKVFGDIHGQYTDLMTFFYKWGEPKEGPNGDILSVDYLFLGDYVDRGRMSLETICLLMALKVKYPNSIHLLRGNHEDRIINSNFGFAEECQKRLNDDLMEDDSVFNMINYFFDYLPLCAIIDDQIFCLHGGIGSSVRKVVELESIPRPLEIVHEANNHQQQIVMDILWSDPTDYDTEIGIHPNTQRDSNNYGNIVKFGPDIVKKFLQENSLSYIIRAHECVLDGFERFAGGLLITVFSATDYCQRHKNAGAMLIVKTNYEIIPHLIYPPDEGNKNWIDDEETMKRRPPTPPRIRYNRIGN